MSCAVGWGVGSLVGQIWDRAWVRAGRRDPLVAARPWPLVAVVVLAVVAAVVGTVMWLRWQNDQRRVRFNGGHSHTLAEHTLTTSCQLRFAVGP